MEQDNTSLFPLNAAIRKNNLNKVHILLEEGVSPNETYGFLSALGLAVQEGHIGIVRALISAGCRLNIGDLRGISPIMIATKCQGPAMVRELIQAGCDLNMKHINGDTAFLKACRDGQFELMEVLVSSGCDVTIRNNSGESALHVASLNGRADIVKFMLNLGLSPNIIQKKKGSIATVTAGITPLHMAVHNNHHEVVQLLVAGGANIKAPTVNGRKPLHIAADQNSLQSAAILLASGADVDVITEDHDSGRTPLHMAVGKGHQKMADLLIKVGCKVNAPSRHGITPVYIAAFQGYPALCVRLIQAGADLNQPLPNGTSYLRVILGEAVRNCSMLRMSAFMLLAGATIGPTEYEAMLASPATHKCERRNTAVCEDTLVWLLKKANTPLSMSELCRISVNGALCASDRTDVASLPIPKRLQEYLHYKELDHLELTGNFF